MGTLKTSLFIIIIIYRNAQLFQKGCHSQCMVDTVIEKNCKVQPVQVI